MSDKQLRYNVGKPKLSYWHSTGVAGSVSPVAKTDGHNWFQEAEYHIGEFLRRDKDHDALAEAIQCLVNGLGEDFDLEYCKVCEVGEAKYARGNFRKGDAVCSYLDSALRHIRKLKKGQSVDPETDCKHAAHALWNVVEAFEQPAWRDDRLPLRPEHPPIPGGE